MRYMPSSTATLSPHRVLGVMPTWETVNTPKLDQSHDLVMPVPASVNLPHELVITSLTNIGVKSRYLVPPRMEQAGSLLELHIGDTFAAEAAAAYNLPLTIESVNTHWLDGMRTNTALRTAVVAASLLSEKLPVDDAISQVRALYEGLQSDPVFTARLICIHRIREQFDNLMRQSMVLTDPIRGRLCQQFDSLVVEAFTQETLSSNLGIYFDDAAYYERIMQKIVELTKGAELDGTTHKKAKAAVSGMLGVTLEATRDFNDDIKAHAAATIPQGSTTHKIVFAAISTEKSYLPQLVAPKKELPRYERSFSTQGVDLLEGATLATMQLPTYTLNKGVEYTSISGIQEISAISEEAVLITAVAGFFNENFSSTTFAKELSDPKNMAEVYALASSIFKSAKFTNYVRVLRALKNNNNALNRTSNNIDNLVADTEFFRIIAASLGRAAFRQYLKEQQIQMDTLDIPATDLSKSHVGDFNYNLRLLEQQILAFCSTSNNETAGLNASHAFRECITALRNMDADAIMDPSGRRVIGRILEKPSVSKSTGPLKSAN